MKEPVTLDSIKPVLMTFLVDHQLMSLATTFQGELWIATVYYAVDEELRFYFVSNLQKLHSQHIQQNHKVAWAINDSQQTPKKMKQFTKCGVQCSGEAQLVNDKKEIDKGLQLWKAALNITGDEYFSVENIVTNQIPQKLFTLVPKKLRFFNEKLFSEEETPLFTLG